MKGDLIEALHQKLTLLHKMRNHLTYSYDKIMGWWRVDWDFDKWDEEQLESLAAFKGRFAEFQDHLASTMELIARIEEKKIDARTYVLNYMVQLYILDSVDEWRSVRGLRNAATHDYSETEDIKAKHFHSLLQNTHFLFETLDNLGRFTRSAYPNNDRN